MNKRIGWYDDKNKRHLPEETISGQPVMKPVTQTVGLGNGYFAVLDTFPKGDVQAQIDALKAEVMRLPSTASVADVSPEAVPSPTASPKEAKKVKSDDAQKPE